MKKHLLPASNFTLIRLGSAIFCALLVLCSISRGEPINPDGLLYLQAAQVYLSTGLKASMAIFPWPFITLTIATTHQITHLPLLQSAYLLNILLVMLFVWGFTGLTQTLTTEDKEKRTTLLAAALLAALYPTLHRNAELITRDLGYWAFTLLSLTYLIRYAQQPSWRKALSFGVLQVLATLYRSEGLYFLFLLPFGLLFIQHEPLRFFNFLRSQCIFIALAFLALIWSYTHTQPTELLSHLQRLSDPILNILSNWVDNGSNKINALRLYVLEPNAQDNGFLMLAGGSFFVFVYAAFKAIGLLYLLLSLYGIRDYFRQARPASHFARPILSTFVILNLLITAAFAAQHQFLMPRYAVPLCFILLYFAARGLAALLLTPKRPLTQLAFVALFFIFLAQLIHTGPSKRYIVESGLWLKKMPSSTAIFSNLPQIMYYAGRSVDYKHNPYTNDTLNTLIAQHKLRDYTYIALYLPRHDPHPAVFDHMTPVAIFSNTRKDRVEIFITQQVPRMKN
ncbi:MAG: hypothetical protein HY939_07710 [Gammaproteobacteria bacterium]|nr:hypothetical protein [Gammaproteobacteria bacterium]